MKITFNFLMIVFYFSLAVGIYTGCETFFPPAKEFTAETFKVNPTNSIPSGDTIFSGSKFENQFFSGIFSSSAFAEEISKPNTKDGHNQCKEKTEQGFTQNDYLQIILGYLIGATFALTILVSHIIFTQRKNQPERSDRLYCLVGQ